MKTKKLLALAAATVAFVASSCGGPTTHHGEQQSYPHQSAAGSAHPPGWAAPSPRLEQLSPRNTSLALATMYDSITLSTVPSNPFALAGYTAGFWPTYLPMRNRWPTAHTVSIAISAGYHADCLDVEPGDAVPSQVPGWIWADKAAGFSKPCVYSSYWEYVNEIRPRIAAAGISRGSIFEWSASYTYYPHLDIGFDATQYTDKAFNENLDASLVSLGFLSIAQPPLLGPTPPPAPKPLGPKQRKRARLALLRRDYRNAHCTVPLRRHKCVVWAHEAEKLVRELDR